MDIATLRRSLFAAIAFATLVGLSPRDSAAQVACGDVISGKVSMVTDLNCVTNPGFTIATGGKVDMAGHTLTACNNCTGIQFSGQGGKLSNGTIIASGLTSTGVAVGGSGVHQLVNVAVVGANVGFNITSNGCKLLNCSANENNSVGFLSTGDKTSISRSHASGSGPSSEGFSISANNCFLNENTSSNNGGTGFGVSGTANKLTRNSVAASSTCIIVFGNGNKLTQNTATGCAVNGIDVIGDNNKVSKSVALGNGSTGTAIVGANNKLTKNTASDNGGNGLLILGNGNNVGSGNTNRNGNAGIRIESGSANNLKSNVSMGNLENSVTVVVGATNNALSKTVALGSGITDLRDDNANCGGNVWAKSIFGTSEAGGVSSHLCIQ